MTVISTIEKEMKEFAVVFFAAITPATVNKLWQIVEHCRWQPGGRKTMTLVIASSGGDVQQAMTAYNYLREVPMDIITHATSVVSSAGLLLYCLGKERRAHTYTHFTLHPMVLSAAQGGYNIPLLQENIGLLQEQENTMASIIASAAGKAEKTVAQDIRQHKVLNTQQAKEYGLVTEISNSIVPEHVVPFRIGEGESPIPSPYAPMSFFGKSPVTAGTGNDYYPASADALCR